MDNPALEVDGFGYSDYVGFATAYGIYKLL